MRIGVPDAELYLRAYAANDREFFKATEWLGCASYPLRTPLEVVNQLFRMGGAHKFAWDFETLALSLSEAGS